MERKQLNRMNRSKLIYYIRLMGLRINEDRSKFDLIDCILFFKRYGVSRCNT